jgi:hypothetical protein
MAADLKGPPNATWADLRQLAWALALVIPFIGLAAYFARVLVGVRAALWLGVALAVLAAAAFAMVVVFCLIASYVGETAGRFNRRRVQEPMSIPPQQEHSTW